MLMMQKYVLLQKAAQKIFYGTLVKTPLLYSLTYTSSRAILPFVKQWIVFKGDEKPDWAKKDIRET
jgi:hypothetical protein